MGISQNSMRFLAVASPHTSQHTISTSMTVVMFLTVNHFNQVRFRQVCLKIGIFELSCDFWCCAFSFASSFRICRLGILVFLEALLVSLMYCTGNSSGTQTQPDLSETSRLRNIWIRRYLHQRIGLISADCTWGLGFRV